MKRLIKYAALLFALILSASIIGGCLMAGVTVVQRIVEKTGEMAENDRNSEGNSLWYRDENGDVVFLGIHFGGNGEVKSGSEQFNAAEITVLDIKVGSAELIVEVYDGETISVEYENIPVEYEFYVDDETLVIDKEDRINFIWNISYIEMPKIHVSVPSAKVFEKINVDKGSGSAKLIGLLADDCNVDNGSGGVNISDCTMKKSVFNSGSGSFIVKNCELGVTTMDSGSGTVIMEDISAKDLRVDAGSGRVEVSGILTGKCDFESGSGSMSVVVYGNEEDYNYRTDMGSGGFYLNGKKADKNYSKSDKRAQYLLTFDAGSGRVSLDFDETKIPDRNNASDNTQNGGSYER